MVGRAVWSWSLAVRLSAALAVVLLLLVITGAIAPGARADAAPAWVEAATGAPLPADTASPSNFTINDSACGSGPECVAVGSYRTVAGAFQALILPIDAGAPGASVAAPLPGNARTTGQNAVLYSISCWSSSSCVAVGSYADSANTEHPFVVQITDGVAASPAEVALPANASSNPYAVLLSVSCHPDGSCVGVGYYANTSGAEESVVVPITNGTPGMGVGVTAPAGGTFGSSLYSVACQTSGPCAAGGSYDSNPAHDYRAMVVPVNGGVPASPLAVAPPTGAISYQDAEINYIACPPSGTCSAVGDFYDTAAHDQDMVTPLNAGVPGTSQEAAAPADIMSGQSVGISGISCQPTGNCVAVGRYENSASNTVAVLIPVSNGVPGAIQSLSMPPDAATTGIRWAELSGVACPGTGVCLAGGFYNNTSAVDVGLTTTFDGLNAGPRTAAPSPADATTDPAHATAGLLSVACGAVSCVAAGDYNNSSNVNLPYVLSAQAPLAISTAGLAAGAIGSAYSQTLAATGSWGAYGWALTSGTLPAGLSLNSTTGVISGTPTTSGTSTFTVQATGTGAPLQTASRSLSITVPAAQLSVKGGSVTVRRHRFGLRLSCAGGACSGTARLQARESYTVKHGHRRAHRHRMVVIGTLHLSLTAGQAQTYTVALSAAGRRALALDHRLTVTVLATIDGVSQTETAGQLTLKAPPVKKKTKRH